MPPFTARSTIKQRIIASEFEAIAVLWGVPGVTGGFQVPITRFTMSFADNLDQLPSARIEAALGLNMRNGTFSEVPDGLSDTSDVSVYFRASGQARAGVPWPSNYHLIWHGEVSGLNINLGVGAFTIAIDSTHWTKKLDYGSCAASNFIKSSFVDNFVTAGGSITGLTPNSIAALEGIAKNAVPDANRNSPALWDKLIVPMLTAMAAPAAMFPNVVTNNSLNNALLQMRSFGCGNTPASQKIIDTGLVGNLQAVSLVARKTLASSQDTDSVIKTGPFTTALPRFAPKTKAQLDKTQPTGFFFNNANETVVSPLNLDIAATPAVGVSSNDPQSTFLSVARTIGSQFGTNLGTHSILDKIVWACNQFTFKCLPNARTVSVAPAIPVFSKTKVWRTLSTDEYVAVSAPSSFPTKLAGVVFLGAADRSSTQAGNAPNGRESYPLGVYFGSDSGRVEILQAPGYLTVQPIEQPLSATSTHPIHSKTKNLWTPGMCTTAALLGCRLSQTQWCSSTFGGYQLSVRCPLRFDIGPGSYLKIENFIAASPLGTNTFGNVYGYVQSVSVSIDAVSGVASTDLYLTHIRPDSDEVEAILPTRHPMFDAASTWSGHELVRMVQDRTGIASP